MHSCRIVEIDSDIARGEGTPYYRECVAKNCQMTLLASRFFEVLPIRRSPSIAYRPARRVRRSKSRNPGLQCRFGMRINRRIDGSAVASIIWRYDFFFGSGVQPSRVHPFLYGVIVRKSHAAISIFAKWATIRKARVGQRCPCITRTEIGFSGRQVAAVFSEREAATMATAAIFGDKSQAKRPLMNPPLDIPVA